MTPAKTVLDFARLARQKADALDDNPLGFWIASIMAGAYVGMGILLIFSVGQGVDPSIRNLVMGASFGIALTLVVFAGSELFTGHTMYMTMGRLVRTVSTSELWRCWVGSWLGNLAGSLFLAVLFVAGGGGVVLQAGGDDLLHAVAQKKIEAPALELVTRAMLCNWLVCLALWTSARTTSDTAKCILIFWCLYAFIAAGFEHSVANMTVFGVALLSEGPETLTVLGAVRNLAWVTIGNCLSGAVIMAGGYWLVADRPITDPAREDGVTDVDTDEELRSEAD
ncbi:MAG: formate/nitrite family transporter [Alphaproteobacteria bacterium]|nr:formate/nitrite family transporter [Alphaproteobacteria bacterium]